MRLQVRTAMIFVLVALVGAIVADAQPSTRRSLSAAESELGGTWRLIAWEDRDRPAGLFIYTADGHVAIQVMRGGAPDAAANPRGEVNGTFHAYFGTFFTVDEAKRIVVHHVEASDSPGMIGTDQPREFEVDSDRLILGNQTTRSVGCSFACGREARRSFATWPDRGRCPVQRARRRLALS